MINLRLQPREQTWLRVAKVDVVTQPKNVAQIILFIQQTFFGCFLLLLINLGHIY